MNQRSSFAFCFILIEVVVFFSLCRCRSLSLSFSFASFHSCGSMSLYVLCFFFSGTAKAQKANTHLNKNELLVHKEEKLRFNRWPLVHFIQLALISHCSRYSNIIFLSFLDALIRATCFVTFTKTIPIFKPFSLAIDFRYWIQVGSCVKFGQILATQSFINWHINLYRLEFRFFLHNWFWRNSMGFYFLSMDW